MRPADTAHAVSPEPDPDIASNIEEMLELEHEHVAKPTVSDYVADEVTHFSGSMLFVWLHVLWFAGWIGINIAVPSARFDSFPFGFLTMIVSLEAIFLSTFVLISQNRQAHVADRRAQLDLQINVRSEQEVTKLLRMVAELHAHMGPGPDEIDPEAREMAKPTDMRGLVTELERRAGSRSG